MIFYHYGFSNYCLHLYCYFYNVLADMSSGLLQGKNVTEDISAKMLWK